MDCPEFISLIAWMWFLVRNTDFWGFCQIFSLTPCDMVCHLKICMPTVFHSSSVHTFFCQRQKTYISYSHSNVPTFPGSIYCSFRWLKKSHDVCLYIIIAHCWTRMTFLRLTIVHPPSTLSLSLLKQGHSMVIKLNWWSHGYL